jgi:hypothetical protein
MRFCLSAIGVAVAGAVACAGDLSGDPENYRVVTPTTVAGCNAIPILTATCATNGCHGNASPQVGLNLGAPGVDARLVGVHSKSAGCESRLLIDPESVQDSFLLEKLTSQKPECGDPMPLVGTLSAEELACIRSWVFALVGADAAAGTPPDASAPPPPDGGSDAGAVSAPDGGGTP